MSNETLAYTVHAEVGGATRTFLKGTPKSELPAELVERLTNPIAFAAPPAAAVPVLGVDTDAGDVDDDEPARTEPPRSGAGSGVNAWRTFAETHGVDVADDASRDDIIAELEERGIIE